jgi:hypothetical protein
MQYFGVDTKQNANKKLSNGLTLYNWIEKRSTQPLRFWGRYIGGEFSLTKNEAEFLHKESCKIALIYNGDTSDSFRDEDGVSDGQKAIEAVKLLNIPEGIAIFADLTNKTIVSYKWLCEFAKTVHENGYTPGFYANTDSSINSAFNIAYCKALLEPDFSSCNSIIWATEPAQTCTPISWEPYCPSNLSQDDIALWKFGKERIRCGNESFDLDMAHDASVIAKHFW